MHLPIAAIVLDFDGVIADTEHLHLAAFQEVFSTRGWTLDAAAYYTRYLGCDDRALIVAYALDRRLTVTDADVDALAAGKAHVFGRFLASGDVLFPGARESIERLATRFLLGIASGALHGEIAGILAGAGLIDRFAVIVGADDVGSTKPSPEPYLTAASRLGVRPAACVAIEDSAPGLSAARAAGMRTVAVTTTSARDTLTEADLIVAGLVDISPDLVAALGTTPAV